MSFQDPNAYYEEKLLLLDQNQNTPTPITDGQVINGDLTPFRHRMEAVNVGNHIQNNGILILRVPPDGTFVRKEPILIDESAKDDYIIEFQMKQDRNKDGVFEEEGKLFRFFIGQPTLQDDEHVGETLKINLIPVEYRTRETLDSERFVFTTPDTAFNRRLTNYNDVKGADNPQLISVSSPNPNPPPAVINSIQLPDADSLRQEWRPLAPAPTHDLFRDIIERQALAGVEGGVFEDFFFDYEPLDIDTKVVTMRAEAEGSTDSGVILDPLVFETSDTQKDNTINVDLIKFKNNVIAEGNPVGGTLPRETSVFSSLFEHAKARPVWDPTDDYTNGAGGTNQAEVRITDTVLEQVRFFKAIVSSGPTLGGAVNPTDSPLREDIWEEDFVTIPEWNVEAEYEKDNIITFPDGGDDRFYKAIEDIPKGDPLGDPSGNPKWGNTGVTFLSGENHPLIDNTVNTGLDRTGRTNFFSYTPWTENFLAMRSATLFGIDDALQASEFQAEGYQGVVPDWNFNRAQFDRVVADSRFEQVSGKSVIKTLNDEPPSAERYIGARYLVSENPSGKFSGQSNKIAEWNGIDFSFFSTVSSPPKATDDWIFSNHPVGTPKTTDPLGNPDGGGDTIVHQARGVLLEWDSLTGQWASGAEFGWDILDTPEPKKFSKELLKKLLGGLVLFPLLLFNLTSALFRRTGGPPEDAFGSSTKHTVMHICKDIKLVTGASGIPGQAFELRFDWQTLGEFNGDKRNFSSIGAWWYMQFPFPKFATGGQPIGDVYANPIIDSNNMDFNHNHVKGWNEGFDSEDLGRLQTITFKAKLSLFGSTLGRLAIGYNEMPMKFYAFDIFDRVWFNEFKLRRNGEFSLQKLTVGENSIQQLHHGRYDELQRLLGIVLDFNWLLKEKEFTGIQFDWRFVKGMGMFYGAGYNSQGLYIANQVPDYVGNIIGQFASQSIPFVANLLLPGGQKQIDIIVNDARLAIDELRFDKQLFANSDDKAVDDARTVLDHQASEVDYLNLKIKAQGSRERKKFVEQAWFMQAHGDVRMRFGEKFIAKGPRVPNPLGEQNLICSEVKHIIDNDGYMMQITGKRKFIFEDN